MRATATGSHEISEEYFFLNVQREILALKSAKNNRREDRNFTKGKKGPRLNTQKPFRPWLASRESIRFAQLAQSIETEA